MKQHNPFYGVIEEQIDDRDYMMGGEVPIPEPENRFQDITYNQNEVAKMSCTLHGAITSLSNLTGVVFTNDELKFLWKKAIELGASNAKGWYINRAIALVREYWNGKLGEFKATNNEVKYNRTSFRGDKAYEIMKKGYMLVGGYRGNRDYNNDAWGDGDCILKLTSLDIPTVYGHCVSIFMEDDKIKVCDNYKGRQCNIYTVSEFRKAVDTIFYDSAYYYVTDNCKIKNEVSEWAKEAVEWCKKEGIATVWDNPQEIIANHTTEIMYNRAGLLTENTGRGISKERMAVILYRINQLNK